jgi:hypothetical protein
MNTMPTPSDEGSIVEIPRESQPERSASEGPYRVLSMSQLLERPTQPWLLRRVIRQGDCVVIFGDPSVGKTFLAIDLGMKVATGKDWWQHAVSQGPVLYLAGEGVSGLRQRVLAWGLDHNVELREVPFSVLPEAMNLLDESQFKRLLETLETLEQKPVLIVIDTLARYMPGGDENSAQHMGLLIDRCGKVQALTGAAVILIHHKNKVATAERGSSALRGAVDVMIEVRRNGQVIEVEGSKAKDTTLLPKFYLQTKSVFVGTDPDGETETSLVIEQVDEPANSQAPVQQATGRKPRAPTQVVLVGTRIRGVLAERFGNRPAPASELLDMVGAKRSAYYAALKAEVAAGRVESILAGGRNSYRLTPSAPEFASLSSSSVDTLDSNSDSIPVAATQAGESESKLSAPPKGAATDSNSNAVTEAASRQEAEAAEGVVGPSDPPATPSRGDPPRESRSADRDGAPDSEVPRG